MQQFPIVLNLARCLGCRRVLLSASRHDFWMCACGTFVDGGNDYIRRGGNPEQIEDLTVVLVDGMLRLLKDVEDERANESS
jgi:hypothetical protein